MIKTGLIKVKSIEYEETVMTMTEIIITTVIMKITHYYGCFHSYCSYYVCHCH